MILDGLYLSSLLKHKFLLLLLLLLLSESLEDELDSDFLFFFIIALVSTSLVLFFSLFSIYVFLFNKGDWSLFLLFLVSFVIILSLSSKLIDLINMLIFFVSSLQN